MVDPVRLLRRLRALHLGALAAASLLTIAGLLLAFGLGPARPLGVNLNIAVIAVPWALAGAVALLGVVTGGLGHRALPVAACGLASVYAVGRFPPRRDEVDRAV